MLIQKLTPPPPPPPTAPFSYFNAVYHNMLVMSASYNPDGSEKDTLRNLRATRDCVVHIISPHFIEAANHAAGNFPPETSEFDATGLTRASSVKVAPPRVAEAALAMECAVRDITPLRNAAGEMAANMVLLEIVHVHVNESIFDADKGAVRLPGFEPIGRLGDITYATTSQVFKIPRPKVK